MRTAPHQFLLHELNHIVLSGRQHLPHLATFRPTEEDIEEIGSFTVLNPELGGVRSEPTAADRFAWLLVQRDANFAFAVFCFPAEA